MKISLVGLDEGVHQFQFLEEAAACGLADHPNFCNEVLIDVELSKGPTHIYLQSRVHTVGHFTCDRCLEDFDLPIQESEQSMFSSDPDIMAHTEGQVHALSQDAREIDITDDLRDLLLLAIPQKLLCAEDCKGLCPGCGVNLNRETCQCSAPAVDLRWQALLKLKN